MRELLIDVSQHISRNRIVSGSARKFQDGKLIYFNRPHISDQQADNKVFCIFTNEMDIRKPVKNAVEEAGILLSVPQQEIWFNRNNKHN